MFNKKLNELIHRIDDKNSRHAIGTIEITKNTGPLQLPDAKRHHFEKHLSNEWSSTRWVARRVGEDSPDYNYQAIVIAFNDNIADGAVDLTYFGDATLTWVLVINNFITSWHAHSGTLNLTSDRTPGQEYIRGNFKDCKMVNDPDQTQSFVLEGDYDLQDVQVIP